MNSTALHISNAVVSLLGGILFSYAGGKLAKNKHQESLLAGSIAVIFLIVSLVFFLGALHPLKQESSVEFMLGGILKWNVTLLSWLMAGTGLVLTTIVALYSASYMEEDSATAKFFPLLLLLLMSVFGLSFTTDLFTLYLFFELLSVCSFALVAFRKDQWEPIEAGIKFLSMSAVGTALILFGIAFVYKNSGTLDLTLLPAVMAEHNFSGVLLPMVCFIIGFGIKAAIFPLHTWLPDAHAEAPSGISAMLSGIIIEIGFFVLFRIFLAAGNAFPWDKLFIFIALITMTAGNVMALSQTKLKRMLAYSSIAQMGYILLGISIGIAYQVKDGFTGGFFHIVTHAFMKGLAFLCAGALIHRLGSGNISDMKGAGWRMPVTAVTFLIAVMALAGVPPLSGFMSKLYIYKAGIQAGTTLGWTASVLAILNSVFSLGYYLPVVGTLFSSEQNDKAKEVSGLMVSAMILLALITLYLGLMPGTVRNIIEQTGIL